MNPKLPLNGCIYTLTVGSVLITTMSRISLCQLFSKPLLKSGYSFMFDTTIEIDKFDCTMHISKIHSLSLWELIHE